jgi:PAS domain S-box-containing protein
MHADDVRAVFFDGHPDPMWVFDVDTLRFLDVNLAAIRKYGWTREEFLAMTIRDIRPEEDLPRLARSLRTTRGLDRDEAGVWRHRTRSGAVIDVDVVAHTVDWNGRPAELVSARDVTAIAVLNRQLEETTELLRIAGRLAKVGGWRVSLPDGGVDWSPETAAIHEAPDVRHVPVDRGIEYYAPEFRDRITEVFGACVRDGTPFDELLQIVTAKGNRVWVRSIGAPERARDGTIVAVRGAFQDVSEAVAARQRSEQLSRRLVATLESMSDAFYTLDREWRFTYLNQRAETLLQSRREQLLGRDAWEAFPDAAATARPLYERALATGETARFAFWYPRLAMWLQVSAYPSAAGLAVYFRDVTAERESEDRQRQAQKLEAIGQLTGGVAHDFNNLLTVMLGNAELLANALAAQPKLRALAETCVTAAERGAELTNRLLAFARRQPLEPRVVEIGGLVAGMAGLLRRTLTEDIDLRIFPDEGTWRADVDPGQLEVALLNLAINARDAMPHGGRLTIEAGNAVLDEDYAGRHADVRPGEYVAISVSDTGAGMAPDVIARAFEPFFTTKSVGKGSGLGLSMVYGFVKQSGGHAKIYSEVGHGTTVRLYLPRAAAATTEAVSSDEPPEVGGHEHVLVVEDDPLVREHAEALLRGLGYRVSAAADGGAALQVLGGSESVDLLFTDIVMPGGMNGRQLADAARALRPQLRVLYTSGYTENAIVHHGRLDPGVQLLAKPYRRGQLAHKVRAVLDAPEPATRET